MCSIAVTILFNLVGRTYARKPASNQTSRTQDLMDKSVGKLINDLFDQGLQRFRREDLLGTTLGSSALSPTRLPKARRPLVISDHLRSSVRVAVRGKGKNVEQASRGRGFAKSATKPANKKQAKGFGKAPEEFRYSGKMRPGVQTPMREVPSEIVRPDYAADGKPKAPLPLFGTVEVKSEKDIEGMRVSGRIAREVLDAAGRAVAIGVTTDYIDAVVHNETIARGAYPSPLNYRNFPKSCCTSVNEVICHGIPDSYKLQDGDIVNIDVTIYYGGYHGDLSEMFLVGNVDDNGKQLVKVTHDAWQAAINYCKPGMPFSGIGAAIEDYIEQYGYKSCKQFVGHGIGKVFHTTPNIFHVRNDEPGNMEVGHVFTIEPMICEGTAREILWNDKWTAATRDGKRSAQFEHTLLVTPNGVEPLTKRLPSSSKFWWET